MLMFTGLAGEPEAVKAKGGVKLSSLVHKYHPSGRLGRTVGVIHFCLLWGLIFNRITFL